MRRRSHCDDTLRNGHPRAYPGFFSADILYIRIQKTNQIQTHKQLLSMINKTQKKNTFIKLQYRGYSIFLHNTNCNV